MKEIDVSVEGEYYSQINNKFMPLSACTPTSLAMALIYEGINVVPAGSPVSLPCMVYPKSLSADDYLTAMANSMWGLSLRHDLTSWAEAQDLEPQTVHAVMVEIVNAVVGLKVTRLRFNVDFSAIEEELCAGHPVVVSGSFTKSGHSVVVVGIRYDDNGTISHVLLDDPYGNMLTQYKDQRGNNVWIPVKTFLDCWHEYFYQFRKAGF